MKFLILSCVKKLLGRLDDSKVSPFLCLAVSWARIKYKIKIFLVLPPFSPAKKTPRTNCFAFSSGFFPTVSKRAKARRKKKSWREKVSWNPSDNHTRTKSKSAWDIFSLELECGYEKKGWMEHTQTLSRFSLRLELKLDSFPIPPVHTIKTTLCEIIKNEGKNRIKSTNTSALRESLPCKATRVTQAHVREPTAETIKSKKERKKNKQPESRRVRKGRSRKKLGRRIHFVSISLRHAGHSGKPRREWQ